MPQTNFVKKYTLRSDHRLSQLYDACSEEFQDLIYSKEYAKKGWKATKKNVWAVPPKSCWGCGREQNQEEGEQFKACSKCVDLGMVPARFCSQECFKEHWPRHKAWHKEFKKHTDDVRKFREEKNKNKKIAAEREKGLGTQNSEEDDNENDYDIDWTQNAEDIDIVDYEVLVKHGDEYYEKIDFNTAIEIYKKAIKLDPRRPEGYMNHGVCLRASKELDQSVRYLEYALERWALTALTATLGEGYIQEDQKDKYATNNWAECIYLLMQDYLSEDFKHRRKPDWFCDDQVCIRVTKLALDKFQKRDDIMEKKLRMMKIQHGTIMGGLFSGGILKKDQPIFRRTPEELSKAAEQFFDVYNMDGYPDSQMHQSRCEQLLTMSVAMSQQNGPVATRLDQPLPVFKGAWITLDGLTSDNGEAMNGKLGLVKRITTVDKVEKVEVQVEDVKETKFFKKDNVTRLPMLDTTISLLATLAVDDQWKYMKEFRKVVRDEAMKNGYGTREYNMHQLNIRSSDLDYSMATSAGVPKGPPVKVYMV